MKTKTTVLRLILTVQVNNKNKDCKTNVSTVEPVQLTGEGEYNLNSIKEEEVTQSFLGMDQSVRGCQNEEHYDECTTRQYIENLRENCDCLPLSIALSDQVAIFLNQIMFQSYSNAGPCLQDNK